MVDLNRRKMDNQVYRVQMTDDHKLEFYVCDTNELNPHRDIKEVGIVVFNGKDIQIDAGIDLSELDSLIKYLTDCREHISKFNKESKITE